MLSGFTQFCASIGCGASAPKRSAAGGASSCHGCCCGQWSYRHGHSGSAALALDVSSTTATNTTPASLHMISTLPSAA